MSTDTPDLVAALDASEIPASDPQPAAAADPTPDPESPPAGETDWRERFEAQQRVNKDLERKLKAAIPRDEAERLREEIAKAQGKEAEYEAARERARTEAEALAKANDRIRRSEIKAAAKGVLQDPTDAFKYLDLESFEVDDDGNVDEPAIAEALAELVKEKPYLAAQGGPNTPKPDPSQGAGGRGAATAAERFSQQLGNLI